MNLISRGQAASTLFHLSRISPVLQVCRPLPGKRQIVYGEVERISYLPRGGRVKSSVSRQDEHNEEVQEHTLRLFFQQKRISRFSPIGASLHSISTSKGNAGYRSVFRLE
jgi:hypothetical protein